MAKTRVCHISTVHQSKDVRIFHKECRSLSKHYEVFLLIRVEESIDEQEIKLRPLRSFKSRFIRILFAPWIAFFKALSTKAKLMHLHDPELLVLTPFFRLFGKHVVFDKHENVADQIQSKTWLGPEWIRTVMSKIYRSYERLLCFFCDSVVVVIPEMQEEFPADKSCLVRNFPSSQAFSSREVQKNEYFTFVYAGDLTLERGSKNIIEAIQRCDGDARLHLIGRWSSERFQDECMALDVQNKVNYLGFLNMDEVYGHLQRAHVGLAPLHPTPNYQSSIPTKVFEYLFAGIAALISDMPYWKSLFEDRVSYANPLDIEELSNAMNRIMQTSSTLNTTDIRKWAINHFSWESEFESLHKSYIQILGN